MDDFTNVINKELDAVEAGGQFTGSEGVSATQQDPALASAGVPDQFRTQEEYIAYLEAQYEMLDRYRLNKTTPEEDEIVSRGAFWWRDGPNAQTDVPFEGRHALHAEIGKARKGQFGPKQ